MNWKNVDKFPLS